MINDTMHLIVKGMTLNANLLWYASVNISSNTVSTWTLVQGTSPSAASLTADQATNRLFLVARGESNAIWVNQRVSSTWQGWTLVPSGETNLSATAALVNNELHIAVIGINNLWHNSMNTTTDTFSGWTAMSGSTTSTPTLTA